MKEIVNACLSCPNPRCETGCPTGNHIRDFIRYLKEDNLEEASNVLYAVNPFPELTSRLCDCDKQCQGHCVKAIKQTPVQIQLIERYISDHSHRTLPNTPDNGHTIAMVGAGVACLSAALALRKEGYQVTIYEKNSEIGGAIYTGIPNFRFDKNYLKEIHEDCVKAGIQFVFNVEIGKEKTFEDLVKEYDRVLLGIGAQVENTFGLSGEGYEAGLTLLHRLNVEEKQSEYQQKYHRAIVWGGGNVAMDCARSLKRILEDVTVLYRRSEEEMPASKKEIQEAREEGVQFIFLENIKELIKNEQDQVTGVLCRKMQLGEPDESGRRSPVEIPDSDYEKPCDLVIAAIGQKVDFHAFENVEKTETHQSAVANVFITGDAYTGPKTVAAAIRDGQEVAKEIMDSF